MAVEFAADLSGRGVQDAEKRVERGASIDTATGEAAPAEISSKRVKAIFSDIAENYDRFNKMSSFGRYKAWLHTLIDESPINSRTRMLDIAGGTGDVTFAACKQKRPGSVLLTDFTPAMLDIAKQRLESGENNGVPVELAVVDAQDIPYASESFDVVTMAYGIRNMPKREQALSEIYRVLRKGGSCCILEFSTPPNAIVRALYDKYLTLGIPEWGKITTGQRDGFVYLSRSIKAFPDQEAFSDMLRAAGFEHVDYVNCTFGVAAVYIARK
ncbi:MAG: ubiquinone/menaquinone biosynthesis methyltransferase [Eggerthellaceae bacterium]|jgi:demethylmenaquinone methyltransferase/2-methoxy-6-polyprenyl-1,4-benzoquinol methylase